MGKRQHQKDKMYLTYTEWSEFYGGKKTESLENEHIKFKRLPFDHCCITMVPFENPFCDLDGNCYELQAIIDFLKNFKVNPISGKPLDGKTLIKMKFYKNNDDEYHCPALFKPFTKNSHIVMVAESGNVFSWEAIEQLNIKTKNWKDLVDDTPFQRKNLITIQDPNNLEKFDITKFYHIKKNLKVLTEEEIKEKGDPKKKIKSMNLETKETLLELAKDYKEPEEKAIKEKPVADKFNAAHYSTGAVAASFTSTAMEPVINHEPAIIEESLVKYEKVKKKGYVRLSTNFGQLNFELHCDTVPRACENFIKHCSNGYYNNTAFHRSIRNFIIQGGDPTATGTGGKSIWGKPFEDEFRPNLSHSGRGILSMANSGPNTNSSQFFITYRSCKHLDGKHTVFGKLVGGIDTLNNIEKIEVDNKDRPIVGIYIEKAHVFVDPFQEAEEQLEKERQEEAKKQAEEMAKKDVKKQAQTLTVHRQGVGKYLDIKEIKKKYEIRSTKTIDEVKEPVVKKRKAIEGFSNFKSW
ncbi:RING-type E3 ubiquitin-protein ligase PPIL2 [Condylostylus longicornis]|uniref:RING-type E3 ubiquitin-protein ligase PPIL2 n=1 Tax=Condylostylus longicornis TaxID=2530218 RepID=UPI00244E0473|nr:RING-type E3 ubiquitin-protein ligase PPIL2 [Condylostylus longicornis]